jgi:hypothetical protein
MTVKFVTPLRHRGSMPTNAYHMGSVILFIRSFLYGTKFIRSLFIRSLFIRSLFIRSFLIQFKIFTVQNLYRSKFIRRKIYTVQNLYGHFLYRSKFIQFKIYTVQNLYWLKKDWSALNLSTQAVFQTVFEFRFVCLRN